MLKKYFLLIGCIVCFLLYSNGVAQASTELGLTCVQSILKPFQKVPFRQWEALRDICSGEIGEKTTAQSSSAHLQARVKRARLSYLLGDFDHARQDINVALEIAELTDTTILPTVSASVALMDALLVYRLNGAEVALPKVKKISSEFPYYIIGHGFYSNLCIQLGLYDEAVIGLQRQARIDPAGSALGNLLFMLRNTLRFKELRDTTLNLIETSEKPYNISEHLITYTEAVLNMKDYQSAEIVLNALKGERADRQNHDWQHLVFGNFPSLANKEVGFYLSSAEKRKLKELRAYYYIQTNTPQLALEVMEGEKVRCSNKLCMELECDLATAAKNHEKASRLATKIENTKFGFKVSELIKKWDRKFVINLPEVPYEYVANHSPELAIQHSAVNASGGVMRISFTSEKPLSFYDMRLIALDYAKRLLPDIGARELFLLSENFQFRTKKAQNALTDDIEFVDQRVRLKILPLTNEGAFDTASLVPWRMIKAD